MAKGIQLPSEIKDKIVEMLIIGMPYSEIQQKLNLTSKSIIARVKNNLSKNESRPEIPKKTKKQKKLNTPKQIDRAETKQEQEIAKAKALIELSKISKEEERARVEIKESIVDSSLEDMMKGGYYDQLKILKYALTTVFESSEDMKIIRYTMPEKLIEIRDALKGSKEFEALEKPALMAKYYEVMNTVGNIYNNHKVRLEAIKVMDKLLNSFHKINAQIGYFQEVEQLIKDIFQSFNVLPEEYYQTYKRELLSRQPGVESYFQQWEATEVSQFRQPQPADKEPTEAEITEEEENQEAEI